MNKEIKFFLTPDDGCEEFMFISGVRLNNEDGSLTGFQLWAGFHEEEDDQVSVSLTPDKAISVLETLLALLKE